MTLLTTYPLPFHQLYYTEPERKPMTYYLNRMPLTPPATLVWLPKDVRAHVSSRRPRVASRFPRALAVAAPRAADGDAGGAE